MGLVNSDATYHILVGIHIHSEAILFAFMQDAYSVLHEFIIIFAAEGQASKGLWQDRDMMRLTAPRAQAPPR